ncbi:hypothetical protein AB6805_29700 [Chitinophaga sp. RCC_12]|uniref:hypothetical protein n=1 Tax=Chitinophaga sp. RCC_12 TaxID=3239226 RepID=UPI003523E035
MKTILVFTNIALLGAVIYLVATRPEVPTERCNHCKDYSNIPLTGLIDANLAKVMSEDYNGDKTKSRVAARSGVATALMNREDTHSIWFDLETIKNFIWKIEAAACRSNCDMKLGIRIYYGKYPDSSTMKTKNDFKELPADYGEKHTLFMVPTFAEGDSQVDFDPVNTYSCTSPKRFSEYFTQQGQEELARLSAEKKEMFILSLTSSAYTKNHGDMAPPPSNKAIFGTY